MQKWFEKKFNLGLNDDEMKPVLERLEDTPGKLEELVKNLPEEKLINKPDNKWSIKENIGHLIDLEELHSARIDDFINGKELLRQADLQNKKTDRADHNSKNIDQLLHEFKAVRKDFIARLISLDKKTLNRKATHPRLNQAMRPVDMAYFVAEHDDHHINTIKKLIEKFSS